MYKFGELLEYTNHEFPISISDCGGLLKPFLKSDVVFYVIPDELKKVGAPLTEAYVIDGPAFVHIKNALQKIKGYGEYCDIQIAAHYPSNRTARAK